jgi:hypothetical protein
VHGLIAQPQSAQHVGERARAAVMFLVRCASPILRAHARARRSREQLDRKQRHEYA